MSITLRTFTNNAAREYIDDLARLRVGVFRDFPYLYEGDMIYESTYLRTFLAAPDSILVIAFDGGRVVGASSGLPLAAETPNLQAPFIEQGYDVARIFYYGESVLHREYRGRGLGVRFFTEREQWARQLGCFDWLTFCGVVRPEDHPGRPAGYVPLDRFWRNRGFKPTDMIGYIAWREVGEEAETAKSLRFWMKPVAGAPEG